MRFLHSEHVGSTQNIVKDYAAKGDFGPLWVRADSQDAGRGRNGRVWFSEKGNFYASGLYSWTGAVADKPLMSFVAANALAKTLSTYIDSDLIRLKWPNDVLVDGAKIAGILLEAGEGWLSIGVGINLEHHPDDLPYPVTHLLEHISEADLNKPEPIYAGPEPILAQLAHNIGQGMAELKIEGFVATRRTWLAKAARLGEEISVNLGGETVTGKFETIGKKGALRLRLPDNTLRDVMAGDVLL